MACSVYYHVHTMTAFGEFIRTKRATLQRDGRPLSVRKLAGLIGVEPSYLSKVERGETPPPSEAKITALAQELGEDPDVLLAMAGKVSSDLQEVILRRPQLFGELIRQLRGAPEQAVLRLVREVRDGEW